MQYTQFRWNELGPPTEPGEYPLRGGVILVKQENIDAVNQRGGNPLVKVVMASGEAERVKQYEIVGYAD